MSVMKYKDPSTGEVKKVFAPTIDAYTKTEADALLAGKAPAGFGLGGSSPYVDDFNTAIKNGWYAGTGSTTNGPGNIRYSGYGAVHVRRGGSTIVCQDFFMYDSGTFNGVALATRASSDYGNTWTPWDYVNPPFESGVVYRTTERYLGSPVYKKMDSNGVIWWSTDQSTWKRESERVGAAPAYSYGTSDLTAGSSSLETGKLYFVYE